MSFQSSTSSTYMDGIPVKISEKYKPPPKVTIPQSIVNRLNSEGYPNGIFDYDFILEKKVIKKIDEWKKFRELERQRRQERLRKLEIERAREIEEKEKLLLTSVSYPNADDLSSGDEDSPEDSSSATASGGASGINCITQSIEHKQFSPLQQSRFDTILMPTVVPDCNTTYANNTSPIYQQQNCQTLNNNKSNGNNIDTNNKINYSDFENDTSSPFDNIELKTINDLDVLAQVLNVTQIHSTQNTNLESSARNSIQNIDQQDQHQLQECKINNKNLTNFNTDYYRNSTNNTPTGEITGGTTTTTSNNQWNRTTTIDNSNPMNHIIHHTLVNNQTNLYYPSNNIFYPTTNYDNTTTHLQNYANMNGGGTTITGINSNSGSSSGQQINSNLQRNPTTDFYYNYNNMPSNQNYLYNSYPIEIQRNNLDISVANYHQKQNFINQQQQQHNFQGQPQQQQQPFLLYHNNIEIKNSDQRLEQNLNAYGINNITTNGLQSSAKSKSKSVPDILQELNDEIRDSELRRARNHSQTLEDHINKTTDNLETNENDIVEKSTTFIKLSSSLQSLVQNISSMGFPLERVAKIAEKLGNDDKKIFEHLIPLSELLDLGFDESKISDALLQFDNNKEQALDFLIS